MPVFWAVVATCFNPSTILIRSAYGRLCKIASLRSRGASEPLPDCGTLYEIGNDRRANSGPQAVSNSCSSPWPRIEPDKAPDRARY